MSLRIIGGACGGRRIAAPPGRRTRPTAERVREAWFSALGDRVIGARVLDLFAGSGALGLEALSRGAASVRFVESDRRIAATLRRNVAALDLDSRARIARRDAFAWLEARPAGSASYDVALADPPYAGDAARRLAHSFLRAPFARLLCVEHAAGSLDATEASWRREYGDTTLSWYVPADPVGTLNAETRNEEAEANGR